MNRGIKFGLVALLIYIIITPIGVLFEILESKSLIGPDVIIITTILLNIFIYLSIILFSTEDFLPLTIKHFFAFIIGALIWFAAGFLFGWFLRKKSGKKQIFNSLGKLLMLIGALIFFILLIIFLWISNPTSLGESVHVLRLILYLFLFFHVVPLLIGFILWLISKFLSEENSH